MRPPGKGKRPLRAFSIPHAPIRGISYHRAMNQILDMIAGHAGNGDVVIGGDLNVTAGERHPQEAFAPRPPPTGPSWAGSATNSGWRIAGRRRTRIVLSPRPSAESELASHPLPLRRPVRAPVLAAAPLRSCEVVASPD